MNASSAPQAAVLGWPIEHSLSPRLHGYWLKEYKIEGFYVPLAVPPANLETTLKNLQSKGFKGVNLTLPHKEAALSLMQKLDPMAARIGAVNTVIMQSDGTLEGRNTDAFGFTENIKQGGFKVSDRPVTILGAGGAARAALVALLDMGIKEIRILNRTKSRAEDLARLFGKEIKVFEPGDPKALKECALLINATSLGLQGQPPLTINLTELPSDAIVTDMVYAPLMTAFLMDAQKRRHKIIDGLGMLLHQARPAFQAFFGRDPVVTDALRQFVAEGLS